LVKNRVVRYRVGMPSHAFAPKYDSHADRFAILRNGAVVGVTSLLALGLLLAARRLAGGFTTVLPTPQLIGVAVFVAAVITCTRLAWRQAGNDRGLDQFATWGSCIGVLLVAFGCSYPGNHLSHWLIWTPVLVADGLLRRFLMTAPRAAAISPLPLAVPDDHDHVVQQLTRVRDDAGVETIRGTLRADLLAGQRHATLHVGFCPPLAALPEIAAEPVDGPDATVKIVQAFAHGARLDVRLEDPADEPCHVVIDFSASPFGRGDHGTIGP
jgi:hypothetical protein